MKNKILIQLISEYKKTLNPKSKWYKEDLENFEKFVSKLGTKELTERLNRLISLNSNQSEFTKTVKKEITLMYNSGMYDLKTK